MQRGPKLGYGIPKGMRAKYDDAVRKYRQMPHILCIQECPGTDFLLSSAERLAKFGFGNYAAITLSTETVDVNVHNDTDTAGRAVPVSGPRGNVTAIFVRDTYDNCPSELALWVIKYGVLFHELGHAEDFRLGKYTDVAKGTSDWQKAEQFADDFASVHLNLVRCDKVVNGRCSRCGLWEVYNHFRYQGQYRKVE